MPLWSLWFIRSEEMFPLCWKHRCTCTTFEDREHNPFLLGTRFLRVKCSWHYFRPVCSEKQTKIFLSCIECRLFSQIVTSFSWTTACIGLTAGHHLPLFMSIV